MICLLFSKSYSLISIYNHFFNKIILNFILVGIENYQEYSVFDYDNFYTAN